MLECLYPSVFFFFNDTATTEIYTLSLHDALPILDELDRRNASSPGPPLLVRIGLSAGEPVEDRKSTRLNSSHVAISYAVFCLKKKTTRFSSGCARRAWATSRSAADNPAKRPPCSSYSIAGTWRIAPLRVLSKLAVARLK